MTFRPNDFLKTIVSSFAPFTSDFVPIFYSFYYFITRKDVVLHEGNSKPRSWRLPPPPPPPVPYFSPPSVLTFLLASLME